MFTVGNVDRYIGRRSSRHSIDTRSTLGRLSIDSRPTGHHDLPMKSTFVSKATQTVNNYELTMMTLKGEAFAGFKIQR